MVKSYCIKEKKQTECIPASERYEKIKNGRLMLKCICKSCGIKKAKFVKAPSRGGNIDVHSLIGKLPKPKAGWTPKKYKYMGPYNPLQKQLDYDPQTGEIIKYHVKPYNKVDEIAAKHNICYDMGKNKGECDRKMVKSLDEMPKYLNWGKLPDFLLIQSRN